MEASTRLSDPASAQSAKTNGGARRPHKKRMLVIVNPYATTVSDRLKNLVVYALQGRYQVEAVMTEAQNHATEIGREAIDGGYDVVVAFGGDGTLNEVAHGLAGTDVPGHDASRAARRTSSAAASASPATWSTRPSTSWASPTTFSRARSTWGSRAAATSSSPAAPDSTPWS